MLRGTGSERGATEALLADVKDALARPATDDRDLDDEDEDMDTGKSREPSVRVSTLEASDCPSITSTMRALIGGFVRGDDGYEDDEEESGDRSWRLAPYDINLLVQWYKRVQARRGVLRISCLKTYNSKRVQSS